MEPRVRLLGSPRVWDGGTWRSAPMDKRFGLLAYLACAEDWVARERLSFLFWPDTPNEQARVNLRQLLVRTRSLPYANQLETDVTRLRWPVTSDVSEFRRAFVAEDWPAAIGRYQGDLLTGFETDDLNEFGAWLELERSQLREAHRRATLRLADRALAVNRPDEAIRLFERCLSLDPLDEGVVQHYLRVLAEAGAYDEAHRLYTRFAARLDGELGLKPSAALEHLAAAAQRRATDDADRFLGAADRQRPFVARTRAPPRDASGTAAPTAGVPPPAGVLPTLTSFVGRESELSDIVHRLTIESCRLLTLLGPGGVGKSRLALHAAESLAPHFADGAFLVPLESVAHPAAIPPAIAAALGLELRGLDSPLEQVERHLHDRRSLLVLDNFEHLAEGALLVTELLNHCPEVRMLVTSRERLRLRSEWLLPVLGLPTPPEGTLGVKEASRYDAIELLITRARQAVPDIRLSEANLAAAARLCRLLDGSPLGIELAAGWLRTVSIEEAPAALEHDLDVLDSDTIDAPDRHRGLRAVFEHSWRLLSVVEQRALRSLAVFPGSFTAGAASAVTGTTRQSLTALVEKSLLWVADTGRYDRHLLLRQFSRERLDALPAEAGRLRDAHTHHFLRLLSGWVGRQHGPQQPLMLAQLTPELENLRAAWFVGLGQGSTAECAAALEPFVLCHGVQGRFFEGAGLFADSIAILRVAPGHDPERSALLGALRGNLAWFLSNLGRFDDAVEQAEAGLTDLTTFDPFGGRIRCLAVLATVAARRGEEERARAWFRNALELARASDDVWSKGLISGQFGLLELRGGQAYEARVHFEEALAANETLGHVPGIVNDLDHLGQLSQAAGDSDAAAAYYERGLALAGDSRFHLRVAYLRVHLAAARLYAGERAAATQEAERALAAAEELGQAVLKADAQLILGQLASAPEEAESLLLQALASAWERKELPTVLAALLAVASLPQHAAEARMLLRLVASHPATGPAQRARATARVEADLPTVGQAGLEPLPSLDAVVEALLGQEGDGP